MVEFQRRWNKKRRRQNLSRFHFFQRLRSETLEARHLLAVITVDTRRDVVDPDDRLTSLREAIFATNEMPGADEIVFDFGHDRPATILLRHGELLITDSLTITGNGPDLLTIDASGNDPTPDENNGDGSRIFNIDDGDRTTSEVTFSGLTLTGGDVDGEGFDGVGGGIRAFENVRIYKTVVSGNASRRGGGIYCSDTDLTVTSSTISGNHSTSVGGGVSALFCQTSVTSSTISRNVADGRGGGIYGKYVSIGRSTISGNEAGDAGGAIDSHHGQVAISNSTITGNSARRGGGISSGGYIPSSFTISNTIIAANVSDVGAPDFAPRATLTYSLIGDNTGTGLTESPLGMPDVNGNLIGDPNSRGIIDPLLGPLADNGGPTMTHALLPGSPVINAGDPDFVAPPDHDQRGVSRVWNGRIDMGAYELHELTVDTLVDESDGDFSADDLSLREAIEISNTTEQIDTIHFDHALDGGAIVLTQGELAITNSLTIDATNLASGLTVDASGNDPTPDEDNGDGSRIFNTDDGDGDSDSHMMLSGVTLTGGDVDGDGGAIRSGGFVTVTDSIITGNSAGGSGGGISGGDVSVMSSTVSGNLAYAGGGVAGSYVTVTNSEVSGNSAVRLGGGLWGRDVKVTSSAISNNSAGIGGGISAHDYGRASVTASTITGNSATWGGGIGGGQFFTVTSSTISGNSAVRDGGGIDGKYITVNSSTISGNSAGRRGGGIYIELLGASVTSSTITGNSAADSGGGIAGHRNIRLTNSVIAKNRDNGHSPDVRLDTGDLTATNSLIGDNSGAGLAEAPIGSPDENGNLIGDPNGQGIIDPLFAQLGNYGGPTPTHALLPASPAINMGDPDFERPSDHDQRGDPFDRVSSDRIDMGAFEYQIAPINFTDDDRLDCADVGAVVAAIVEGDNPTPYDFTGDAIVDIADLEVWLALAGLHDLPSRAAYLPGDANLDGKVDATDLNIIGLNWLQDAPGWCSGDFTADGVINANDLNSLALNWQTDVSGEAAAQGRVPRAPLVRHVTVPMPPDREAPARAGANKHRSQKNVDTRTSEVLSTDTPARQPVRRHTFKSSTQRSLRQEWIKADQQRVLDEVLERWMSQESSPLHKTQPPQGHRPS